MTGKEIHARHVWEQIFLRATMPSTWADLHQLSGLVLGQGPLREAWRFQPAQEVPRHKFYIGSGPGSIEQTFLTQLGESNVRRQAAAVNISSCCHGMTLPYQREGCTVLL